MQWKYAYLIFVHDAGQGVAHVKNRNTRSVLGSTRIRFSSDLVIIVAVHRRDERQDTRVCYKTPLKEPMSKAPVKWTISGLRQAIGVRFPVAVVSGVPESSPSGTRLSDL